MTSTAAGPWRVGIDSGGTFTDLVALDDRTGAAVTVKVPSTPARPAEAVGAALAELSAGDVRVLVHGTTVATNAVLQRTGAKLCLLTTRGFEDVPHIQRINRPYAFDLTWEKPRALVARRHCLGVAERVAASGEVVVSLEPAEIERVTGEVARLVGEGSVDAVAISLLFSYANDAHERALAEALARELPDVPVSLSSRVSPTWREYERTSTVLADAYVRPLMTSYLDDVERELGTAALLLLKSNGGTATPASVKPIPVTMLLSGLAGGAVGGAHFAALAGEARAITLDIGGTSTDVGLVDGAAVRHVDELDLEWGVPVTTPTVDVRTVGAGGGSIAHVDAGGLLRVGPASAGALPGPAAYGLGGTEATVTDADLVLGRLNPEYFLGGRIPLDAGLAEAALAKLGAPIGLSAVDAALAVSRIATENVASAIRLVTIERGIDPRDHALVAFGGAGPTHACAVAEVLGIARVVVPPHPGLCSALGAALAPLRVDRLWTLGGRSDRLDEEAVREAFEGAQASCVEELRRDGLPDEPLVSASIGCRYYMQNYEEEVPVASLGPGFLEEVATAFHRAFRARYGYAFENEPVEFVHCKVTAREAARERPWQERGERAQRVETRAVYAPDGAERDTAVLRRGVLEDTVEGPALVEEPDSTTYVPPGWTARDAAAGCLLLERAG